MLFKTTRRLFSFLLLISGMLAIVGLKGVALAEEYPTASCSNGVLAIVFSSSSVNSIHAVRIDDQANGWNGTTPLPGDFIINNVQGSSFTQNVTPGHSYVWWFHDVSAKGIYGTAKAGSIHCTLQLPTGLKASYDGNNLTLSWDAVPGAAYYAVRADNMRNPWNPDDMQHGDRIRSVAGTSFTFQAVGDTNYVWWVHAVEHGGIYSDPAFAGASTIK
jgi:hypothetical protein